LSASRDRQAGALDGRSAQERGRRRGPLAARGL